MKRAYAATSYADSQLFIHDNRDTDLIEFLPPVSTIGRDRFTGEFVRYRRSDEAYQEIADAMAEATETVACGEGWDGMGRHISEMTDFDRMIFEDCHDGSGHIQRRSVNIPQVAKHLRPEWLQVRIEGADINDCQVLVECFRTLDATPKMVKEFISWLNARDLDAGIEYFVNLAYELALVEQPSAEALDIDPEIEAAYCPGNMTDYQDWSERHTFGPGIPEDCHMPNDRGYAYVTINDELPDDEWMDRQSPRFKRIMTALPKIKSYMRLKELGSKLFKKDILTSGQAMVFWSAYKRRKAQLKAAIIKRQPVAAQLVTRINAAPNSKVRFIGFWLFDQQSKGGKTTPSAPVQKLDEQAWSMVWEAYAGRKATLPDVKANRAASAALDAAM